MLSVIVPAYNEEETIGAVLSRLVALPLKIEIIVVDDGSTDGTAGVVAAFSDKAAAAEPPGPAVTLLRHGANRGKGAAVSTGFAQATGAALVVQDADLEYFPEDLVDLFAALDQEGRPVVFGSRNLGYWRGVTKGRGRPLFYFGGRLVGWTCNLLFGTRLTDAPTGYKMFRREVLNNIRLKARGFGFCAEFCGRAAKAGYPIHEIPIRYAPRTRAEGKKLRARDGVKALLILIALRLNIW